MLLLAAPFSLTKFYTINKYLPITIAYEHVYPVNTCECYEVKLPLIFYSVFHPHDIAR